jgi:hypothetical protein
MRPKAQVCIALALTAQAFPLDEVDPQHHGIQDHDKEHEWQDEIKEGRGAAEVRPDVGRNPEHQYQQVNHKIDTLSGPMIGLERIVRDFTQRWQPPTSRTFSES